MRGWHSWRRFGTILPTVAGPIWILIERRPSSMRSSHSSIRVPTQTWRKLLTIPAKSRLVLVASLHLARAIVTVVARFTRMRREQERKAVKLQADPKQLFAEHELA
jgi:hypothetical protein